MMMTPFLQRYAVSFSRRAGEAGPLFPSRRRLFDGLLPAFRTTRGQTPASPLRGMLRVILPVLLWVGCGGSPPAGDEHADHTPAVDSMAMSGDEHAGHTHGAGTGAPLLTDVADSRAGAVIASESAPLYTCSMHPQVLSDEPGVCPICGMDLTPVRQTTSNEGVVTIDPFTIQNIGVRTAPVTVETLDHQVRTTGRFRMDERGAYTVSLKVGGWVERLFADYEGAIVQQGQPLLELYSPELVSTQEEYLLALRNARRLDDSPAAADAQRLLDAARRRLAYWDLSDEQIAQLEASGHPTRTLTFYAPASGEVMNKQVVAGQQIQAGQALMDIVDQSEIWLIADVYEQDLGWVDVGTQAHIELPYQPGQTWRGRVDHLYYMLDREARTARARIVLPGGDRTPFKPGMYATVYLEGEATAPAPVVPEEAVIRSGEQTWVILSLGGGRFLPRVIRPGVQAGGKLQVLDGLDGTEMIVTSAQFLIDSEARLQSAIGTLAGGHQHESGTTASPPGADAPSGHVH